MVQLNYSNIFDAFTPDKTKAAELQFRADMMIAMRGYFEDRGWSQADIGRKLGVSQPRVSELVNGRIHTLSADKLIGYLALLGFQMQPVFKSSTSRKPASIACSIKDCEAAA